MKRLLLILLCLVMAFSSTLMGFGYEETAKVAIASPITTGPNTFAFNTSTANVGFISPCITPYIPVNGMKLNQTNLYMMLGSTYQLTATISPYNATNNAVKWSSSNLRVATVTTSGLVKIVGQGSTTIVAKTVDGGFKSFCSIHVFIIKDPNPRGPGSDHR